MISTVFLAPSTCPTDLGNPFAVAHLPLPSTMNPTCLGIDLIIVSTVVMFDDEAIVVLIMVLVVRMLMLTEPFEVVCSTLGIDKSSLFSGLALYDDVDDDVEWWRVDGIDDNFECTNDCFKLKFDDEYDRNGFVALVCATKLFSWLSSSIDRWIIVSSL